LFLSRGLELNTIYAIILTNKTSYQRKSLIVGAIRLIENLL